MRTYMRRRTHRVSKKLRQLCQMCHQLPRILVLHRRLLFAAKEKRLGGFEASPHIGVPLIGGRKYGGGETSDGGWSIEGQIQNIRRLLLCA